MSEGGYFVDRQSAPALALEIAQLAWSRGWAVWITPVIGFDGYLVTRLVPGTWIATTENPWPALDQALNSALQ